MINSYDSTRDNNGLTHITIKRCAFNHNGSTGGYAVFSMYTDVRHELYSILLEGNTFTRNSSHINRPIVGIYQTGLNDREIQGETMRSMIMRNNKFEENGSHGDGVVYISGIPNVDILDDNIFSSNTDKIEFNTEVLSYFIDNGYYLKKYLELDQQIHCFNIIYVIQCHNTRISHLKIENNSCDCSNYT